jgi:hypothetical protein
MSDLASLLENVRSAKAGSNALDMEIEIALFKPDGLHTSVRQNAAGTKLVYTRQDGGTDTHWAADHTLNAATRERAIALLTALITQETPNGN